MSCRRMLTVFALMALLAIDNVFPCQSLADSAAAARIEVPQQLPPHPRLFLNQQEIERLKQWIAGEPWLREYVDKFLVATRVKLADIPSPLPTIKDRENAPIAIFAHESALAYVLSGERPFAQAAAQVLLSYVPVYEAYAVTETKGKALPSTLNEARWAAHYASAYDLIYNSGVLSEKHKQAIESRVLRPCGEVLRICNHKRRSNWRARALAGIGIVGFCINDRSLIDEALHGFRDKQGTLIRNGFVHHVSQSVLADGIFYERSFGYQAYTTDSYFLLMEAARHSGVDLWNHQSRGHSLDAGSDVERMYGETGSKTIKPLFDALFFRTFSDGAVSVVANASLDHFQSWRFYDAAWRAWRDPKFAFASRIPRGERRPWEDPQLSDSARLHSPTDLIWLEPDLPRGHFNLKQDVTIGRTGVHKNACTLFPNGGYAILRQSTDPGAVCVEMNFGCWGSGHSHPDKLSIVVSDGSRKAIREVAYFGYGDERHLTWDRQTIAHNTVTVDQISQAPQGDGLDAWPVPPAGQLVRGRPLLFYPGKRLKVFRAECLDAYDGVRLERTIVLVDSIVVDFFLCRSDKQHVYDYALHIDGEISGKQTHESGPLSDQFGYRHITDLERIQAPCAIEIVPDGTIDLLTGGNVTTGMGIVGKNGQRRSVVVVRQEGKNAIYVSGIRFNDSQKWPLPQALQTESEQRVELPGGLAVLNTERGVSLLDAEGVILEQASAHEVEKESTLEP